MSTLTADPAPQRAESLAAEPVAAGAGADVQAATDPPVTADAGMSTAEYAVGTVAACAFAALLYKVITSSEVLGLLTDVVTRALHVPF